MIQCFFFSRSIRQFTPKKYVFLYLEKYFRDQSIQKILHLILKTEALMISGPAARDMLVSSVVALHRLYIISEAIYSMSTGTFDDYCSLWIYAWSSLLQVVGWYVGVYRLVWSPHGIRFCRAVVLSWPDFESAIQGRLDNSDRLGVAKVSKLERIPSYWDAIQSTSRIPSRESRPTYSGFRVLIVRVIETHLYSNPVFLLFTAYAAWPTSHEDMVYMSHDLW